MEKVQLKKIGIMGVGMVGGALRNYFEENIKNDIILYDPPKGIDSVEDLNKADIIFVCVPTPFNKEENGFDLSFVEDSLKLIKSGKVAVIKSTVVPGTCTKLQAKFPGLKIMFNPEFLTEATAGHDMAFPKRQIMGVTDKSIGDMNLIQEIFGLLPKAPFTQLVDTTTAELIKYFGNSWYATKVVFANQMYDLCQKLDVNYKEVKEAVSAEDMVGKTHLSVMHNGFRGYGGKCLLKDTRAIIQLGDEVGCEMELLKKVDELNSKLNPDEK